MSAIISVINSLAPLIMVVLAFGIIFRVIRIRSILFFVLFLILLPFLGSAVTQAVSASFSGISSWKVWVAVIFIGLIAFRLFIDRVFRR